MAPSQAQRVAANRYFLPKSSWHLKILQINLHCLALHLRWDQKLIRVWTLATPPFTDSFWGLRQVCGEKFSFKVRDLIFGTLRQVKGSCSIKQQVKSFFRKINLKSIFAPSTIGAVWPQCFLSYCIKHLFLQLKGKHLPLPKNGKWKWKEAPSRSLIWCTHVFLVKVHFTFWMNRSRGFCKDKISYWMNLMNLSWFWCKLLICTFYQINWTADSCSVQLAGFIVGLIPLIRKSMIGGSAPLRVIQDSASLIGYENQPQTWNDVAMIFIKSCSKKFWSSHILLILRNTVDWYNLFPDNKQKKANSSSYGLKFEFWLQRWSHSNRDIGCWRKPPQR